MGRNAGQIVRAHTGPIVAAGLIALVLMFALDRNAPLKIEMVAVEPLVVAPGQLGTVVANIEWRRLCKGTIRRRITTPTEEVKEYDPSDFTPRKLGARQVKRPFRIPPDLTPGTAYYDAEIRFVCTPLDRLWPITVRTGAVPFTVVKRVTENKTRRAEE